LIYFIANPAAGSGRVKTAVPIIEKIMRENNIDHSVIYTEKSDDFIIFYFKLHAI